MKIHFTKNDLLRMARILRDYRGLVEDQVFAKRMSKAIVRQANDNEGDAR